MSRQSILLRFTILAATVLLSFAVVADAPRSMKDIKPAISALLESTADDAYLVIGIAGSNDFVQMSGYLGTAELDFPQLTDRQKQLRPKIEKVCGELGLDLVVNVGSDGSEFLDYELPKSADEIARIVRSILSLVYEANDQTGLEFEANSFSLPAA